MARPKSLGIKLERLEFDPPGSCYEAGPELVCFIPRRMYVLEDGQRDLMSGYILAARKQKEPWRFLDSDGFRTDRSRLWMLFPLLPKQVHTPPVAMQRLP